MRFKKIWKTIISVILAAGITLSYTACPVNAAPMLLTYNGSTYVYEALPIRLLIEGRELTDLPMPPVIFNGSTMVPVREVFEAMGAVVTWNKITSEIYVGYNETMIVLQINNKYANINGQYIDMGIAPLIINGKTMIPVRFTAESLGFLVDWHSDDRVVNIGREISQASSWSDTDPRAAQTNNGGQANVNYVSNIGESETISLIPNPGETQFQTELAKDVSSAEITTEIHQLTTITKLSLPQDNPSGGFTIEATSPITQVDKMLLQDNRLVLDIHNAECGLEKDYTLTDNPAVGRVRAAQNQVTPAMITRVVFELTSAVNYSIQLSADRKAISVLFEENAITDVSFQANEGSDLIYITFKKKPGVNIYPMTDPNRIIIDMPLSRLEKAFDQSVSGRYASAVHASQHTADMSRIMIDLKEMAKYDVTYEANIAKIKLSDLTVKNVSYDRSTNIIKIMKNKGVSTAVENIVHTDRYLSYQYGFTLVGDYENVLGYGEYIIKDDIFNSIVVESDEANTTIWVNAKRIFAYNVTEDNDYYYIQAIEPKQKYQRIVIVDPGHGAEDNGSSGNGLIEKNLTIDIAMRLMTLIERDGYIKAYATRLTDVKPSRPERAEFANNLGDIFTSIHINSSKNSPEPNGTEVFYYPHTNDSSIGFSSQSMADTVHKELLGALGSVDRKVKKEPYDVLTLTKIPAVLCEIGFISNPEEASKLASEAYRQKAAEGIYKGLLETFGRYTPVR